MLGQIRSRLIYVSELNPHHGVAAESRRRCASPPPKFSSATAPIGRSVHSPSSINTEQTDGSLMEDALGYVNVIGRPLMLLKDAGLPLLLPGY